MLVLAELMVGFMLMFHLPKNICLLGDPFKARSNRLVIEVSSPVINILIFYDVKGDSSFEKKGSSASFFETITSQSSIPH